MFYKKFKSISLIVIQKRLFIIYVFENYMRMHQRRITSYFKSINNNQYNYIFYHFIIHTNSHNITFSYIRK